MKKKVTASLKKVKGNTELTEVRFISTRHEEDEHGSSDNIVTISLDTGGAMFFSDDGAGEGFVYLYPEQVKHLESVLKKRKSILKGKGRQNVH